MNHGVNGLLAQPADAADLARCIEHMLSQPERAREMALKARGKVESDFDVTTESGKLYAAIA